MRETQIVGWMIVRWMGEADQWENHEIKIEALDGIPVEDQDEDDVIEWLLSHLAQKAKPSFDDMVTVMFHGTITCESSQSIDGEWDGTCTPDLISYHRKWSSAEAQDYYDVLDEGHEPC